VESVLKRSAAALVLARNHPNGHTETSEQHKALTRAVALAAQTIHLKVVDHLILAPHEVLRFRKAGLL